MARILCVWSPNWAIENWRRRNPSAAQASPLALIATVRGVRRLADLDVGAVAAGLYRGQKATDALALAPDLTTAEADPQADACALTELADWCVRFSPAVAPAPPDGLFLDVTGVDHLWGGEHALAADLQMRLARNGLTVRLALADTAGAAWALARHGAGPLTLAPSGGQAELLAPLPPAALRLEPEAAAQLGRLGLRRLAQIMDMPRAPLARRFGPQVLNRLDQALGRAEEALAYRRPPSPWFARLAFAEPISALEDLERVTCDITTKLCGRLEAEGRGARRFHLAFHRLDGRAQGLSVGLSQAGRDAVRLSKLFRPKLEQVDPGFGIEVATLAAEGVETLAGRQIRLDADAAVAAQDGIVPLVDRLANRLGEGRVWKAVPVESHVPERAVRPAPPLAATSARGWDPEIPRPLRLFRRPEPLEAVMALTPDDPPRQFQWRGRLHRVRHAEGPERIGQEWWRGLIEDARTDRVRDYYRVEDQAGGRFWIYRSGLYVAGTQARWWLHGLFG